MQARVQEYLNMLNFLIRTNSDENKLLLDILISLHWFLKNTKISIIVSHQQVPTYHNSLMKFCPLCRNYQYIKNLDCGHGSCRQCLKSHALQTTHGTLVGKIPCFICNEDISSRVIYRAFTTKIVTEIRRQSGFIDTPMFLCEICTNEIPVEDGITLGCDDRFCKPCLEIYIKELIYSSQVQECDFHCPKCPKPIEPAIVQGNFSNEIYVKYLDFCMEHFKPISEDLICKKCPFCLTFFEIPKSLKSLTCKGCGNTYCPQCNENHPYQLCERLRKNHNASVEGSSGKPCPKCGEAIEKAEGCNFVKCPWPKCKDSFFCFLCGKSLTRLQHYSHYFQTGPFGSSCNTLDNIKD